MAKFHSEAKITDGAITQRSWYVRLWLLVALIHVHILHTNTTTTVRKKPTDYVAYTSTHVACTLLNTDTYMEFIEVLRTLRKRGCYSIFASKPNMCTLRYTCISLGIRHNGIKVSGYLLWSRSEGVVWLTTFVDFWFLRDLVPLRKSGHKWVLIGCLHGHHMVHSVVCASQCYPWLT